MADTDFDDQRKLGRAESLHAQAKTLLGNSCVEFAKDPTPARQLTLNTAATTYREASNLVVQLRGIVANNERRWRR